MRRRRFLNLLGGLAALPVLSTACAGPAQEERLGRIGRSRAYWAPLLERNQYAVLFEEATEPAGSHPLNREKRAGVFHCAACYLPLFSSEKKYDSGTGWPSFWEPLPDALATKTDRKLFYPRTEYHCARCGGHQGHVFDDGPPPTGLRYCNNGLALHFVPAGTPAPALRG